MRKRLVSVLFFAAAWALLQSPVWAQDRPALVDAVGYADMILVNGKIVSMDDRSAVPDTPGHIYQAMAIKGEKIMALGTNDEMRRLGGAQTQVVDMGGKTVIPGLIQPHYHLFGPAANKYGPQLGLVDPSVKLTVVAEKTAEATARKLRDTIVNAIEVQKLPKGQWITVDLQEGKENRRGTTFSWLYLGNINRRHLDSGTENNPVLVKTGLQGVLNTVAVAEIKKEFPGWDDSTDLENRPGSSANGYVAVPEIGGLTFEYWWQDKPLSDLAEAMRLHGLDVLRQGYTTIATRILYPRVVAAFHQLNREGRLPHRLAYYIESQRGNFFDLKSTREFYKGMGAPWTTHAAGNKMLWLNGMTNEVWDSIYNEVCLGPDVPASPEIKARERCPGPGSKPWESVKAGILTGWRPAQVHSTSSHGGRLYLQMLEEAMKEGNYSLEYMRSLRTTMEHNGLLGIVPDVIAGIKKFGIILNVRSDHLGDVRENVKDYGEVLITRKFAMPIKTWLSEGIRVTFEAQGLDPWVPVYELVTRQIALQRGAAERAPLLPDEAIDRVTALKMQTTWASEYVMGEDTLGSLEPGKYADFTVLDRDFFSIPIEEVRSLKTVMTGLGGKIVYDQSRQASNPSAR
ncbi:MAG: amidohydrolase family protein [Acidobacteria bacterium]|nr:amidohydrolase family protein [Acidobacteriota bacterium]